MLGNAELIELLRRMSPRLDMLDCENVLTAADRIEELVKERKAMAMRDAGYDVYAGLEAKLAKAMEALREIYSISVDATQLDLHARGWIEVCTRNVLAELEGK